MGQKTTQKGSKMGHFGVKNDPFWGPKGVQNGPLEGFENYNSTPHEFESRVFKSGQTTTKRGSKSDQILGHF